MGYLARHDDVSEGALRRAMFFGAALASFCVEEIGTKRLMAITQGDLARRIQDFARLVDHGTGLTFVH